jgi:glycosyltransferase involved in cell wall biosynthesis
VPTRAVLHVLPIDLYRGAQTYARELRTRLDGDDVRHSTLTLFRSTGGNLQPDRTLDVPPGWLRRAGLDPRAVLRLRRELRAHPADVVVAHGGEPLKYVVAAGVEPARLVYYKIGVEHGRLGGMRLRLHRMLLRRAGVVAAVSEGAAREARAHGVPDDRIRVIPNGRDPARYPEHDARDGAARLVWIGHFDASKRPEWFVDVVRELHACEVACSAVMAGEGPLLDGLRPAAAAVGVELRGTVADVPELLAASDLLVFTGRPPEGLPGVLIEAAMAGLPVVTTAVPGAADVVAPDVTGVIVAVDDFAGLLASTRALAVDGAARRRLGVAARQRAETHFSLDGGARQWQELLDELLTCTSST